MQQLILASSSPRRQELLRQVGIPFVVAVPEVDEHAVHADSPAELVERLALRKARAVSVRYPGAIVLGADTIVVVDGEVLGKPADRAEAEWMLGRLSGRSHQVLTGVALVRGDEELVAHEETVVRFAPLSREQIQWYVETGEPMDKAGAYGIQGRAAALIASISGDYYNVVGLPLHRTVQMLTQFGYPIFTGGAG
ncbi:Maf family protein [Symbiobacterium thermophilum]|uniref:dTTP/UTP pyrophosphatase n=3 Tax=Symbiobacterium thermophilum TaxID=2734 RepID=NTPPA_SYMTH|nr:Maf family protein [Symbiobacterium thermophilum]Q67SI8.1 RecName: Full=dTTP/UTP pyrophosphatase; Short=dTTPase/UTPase; AltName: Full=Nucleoside triphosphate pyrophosphatase; AltName: Full=Nucleotide pyrophosphatase; Short=Nucleotide PPase [Symbiobacterium thermophilum IAM 14863]MBY6275021.1 septum formation inhibitor Maf [Symbiobacterium thermophilum]BAD39355.1 septum formation protein Maf [Symbiobacterium thermophilum IAM 14863]